MSLTWEEEQAIRTLGANERREIVDALLRSIQQGDAEQREAATDRLSTLCIYGIVADVVPIEPFAQWLGAEDQRLRQLAEYGLANTDGRALPTLIAQLDHAVAEVRASAATALAQTGDSAASSAPYLRQRLQDPVAQVRQRAAFALGLIHASDEPSVLSLLALAQSPEGEDRSSATHALGKRREEACRCGLAGPRAGARRHGQRGSRWRHPLGGAFRSAGSGSAADRSACRDRARPA